MNGYCSTCPQKNPVVTPKNPYSFSQDLQENFFIEPDATTWPHVHNKNSSSIVVITINNRTGNASMSHEQAKNLDKLYDISQLKDDWNGYGSKEISKTVIDASEFIIKNICIQPTIYATGRNSIQMQYELSDRSYLEFEVFEEKIICMKVPQRIYSKASFEEIKGLDMDLINKIVREFLWKIE